MGRVTMSGEAYFLTPNLSGLINQLKHLSVFGADVLVVEGDSGSGKSAMSTYFVSEIQHTLKTEASLEVVNLTALSGQSFFEWCELVAESLGLGVDGARSGGELLFKLRAFEQHLVREKKLLLVLIDDAQFLANEALAALLSLLQGLDEGAFGLRFLLFSQSGLVKTIDALGIIDVTVYDFSMPEFSSDELERFLSQRFIKFDDWLDAEVLPSPGAIWSRSRGNPGVAIRFVEGLTTARAAMVDRPAIVKMPLLHLVSLSVVLAVCIFIFAYKEVGDEQGVHEGLVFEGGEDAVVERHADQKLVPATTGVVLSVKEAESAVLFGEAQDVSGKPVTAVSPSIENALKNDEFSFGDKVVREAGMLPVTSSLNSRELETIEGFASVPSQSVDVGALDVVVAKVSQVPDAKPVKSAPKQADENSRLSRSEQYLMSLTESEYVLQLVAASSKQNLESYIQGQGNSARLHMYRRLKASGGHWYIVVAGPYSSKRAAAQAVSSLPKSQKASGPWPKSIAAVRREIQAFQRN